MDRFGLVIRNNKKKDEKTDQSKAENLMVIYFPRSGSRQTFICQVGFRRADSSYVELLSNKLSRRTMDWC